MHLPGLGWGLSWLPLALVASTQGPGEGLPQVLAPQTLGTVFRVPAGHLVLSFHSIHPAGTISHHIWDLSERLPPKPLALPGCFLSSVFELGLGRDLCPLAPRPRGLHRRAQGWLGFSWLPQEAGAAGVLKGPDSEPHLGRVRPTVGGAQGEWGSWKGLGGPVGSESFIHGKGG